jgi:glucose-6-phosphate 1-dehydrogenase
MNASVQPVAPFDLVVFGGTGDLSRRKLMPALYYRERDGQLPAECSIIGTSRGDADFAGKMLSAMRHEFGGHVERTEK